MYVLMGFCSKIEMTGRIGSAHNFCLLSLDQLRKFTLKLITTINQFLILLAKVAYLINILPNIYRNLSGVTYGQWQAIQAFGHIRCWHMELKLLILLIEDSWGDTFDLLTTYPAFQLWILNLYNWRQVARYILEFPTMRWRYCTKY